MVLYHLKLAIRFPMGGQVPDLIWVDGTGELAVDPLRVSTDQVGAITFLYDN